MITIKKLEKLGFEKVSYFGKIMFELEPEHFNHTFMCLFGREMENYAEIFTIKDLSVSVTEDLATGQWSFSLPGDRGGLEEYNLKCSEGFEAFCADVKSYFGVDFGE